MARTLDPLTISHITIAKMKKIAYYQLLCYTVNQQKLQFVTKFVFLILH